MKIKINNKAYDIKFGIKSNIILGDMWGCSKISQVGEKLGALAFEENQEPTMKQLQIMAQLILSGVLAKNENAKIDEDDIFKFILQTPEEVAKIFELYTKSLPTQQPEIDPNAHRGQK